MSAIGEWMEAINRASMKGATGGQQAYVRQSVLRIFSEYSTEGPIRQAPLLVFLF